MWDEVGDEGERRRDNTPCQLEERKNQITKWRKRGNAEMKNSRLNKISIILEFVQYHYVAIFSLFRSLSPAHCGSLSKSLLMPQPLALRLRTSTQTHTHTLFIVRVPSFIGIGTQSFFAASNSSSSSPSPLIFICHRSRRSFHCCCSFYREKQFRILIKNTFKLLLVSDR